MPAEISARLKFGGVEIAGRVVDLSMGGARFVASDDVPDHPTLATKGELVVRDRLSDEGVSMQIFRIPGAKVASPLTEASRGIGLSFDATDAEAFLKIVSLVHGDSERWEAYWHRNDGNLVMLEAIRFLLWSGIMNSSRHMRILVNRFWNRMVSIGLPEQDNTDSEMAPVTDTTQN